MYKLLQSRLLMYCLLMFINIDRLLTMSQFIQLENRNKGEGFTFYMLSYSAGDRVRMHTQARL